MIEDLSEDKSFREAFYRLLEELAAPPITGGGVAGVTELSEARVRALSDQALADLLEEKRSAFDAAIDRAIEVRRAVRVEALAPLQATGRTADALELASGSAS